MDHFLIFVSHVIEVYFTNKKENRLKKVYCECFSKFLADTNTPVNVKYQLVLLVTSFLGRIDGTIESLEYLQPEEICNSLLTVLMASHMSHNAFMVLKTLQYNVLHHLTTALLSAASARPAFH